MGCKVRRLGESLGKQFRQLCQARIQGLGCWPRMHAIQKFAFANTFRDIIESDH